jgi:molecular chaperone GrpE
MKKEKKKDEKKILKEENKEYLEGWKRAKADLLNYKKDEGRRIEKIMKREKEELFKNFLFILDNFDRAEEEVRKKNETNEIIEGFLKIKEQLNNFLKNEGIEEMTVIEEDFDPYFHDAIEVVEDKTKESGKIIEELQKGYLYKNEVIRPAKVKVIK